MNHPTAQDAQSRKIRDWLLALLRFSITLEPGDRAAVMALADEMDRLGFAAKKPEFSFFLRTTSDVCNAVADWDQAGRKDILRQHLARIQDPRLRRAFLAVFDFERHGFETAGRDRRAILTTSVHRKMLA
jgi:hypothetical protein